MWFSLRLFVWACGMSCVLGWIFRSKLNPPTRTDGVKDFPNNILSSLQTKTFEHQGWKCAYRYKEAKSASELPPLVLVHPVGIGLSSWFWEPLMQQWEGEAYALDLIGCGTLGGDFWDPQERGMFFPLTWAQQVQTLIENHIQKPCIVVCQGGTAPIGVVLAKNSALVDRFVLTSPPIYSDMVYPLSNHTLQSNFDFYTSWRGKIVFQLLENQRAISLFSNLFLFEDKADQNFIDLATLECQSTIKLRPPIMAFNAGLLQHRSFYEDMQQIFQPTLILSGTSDRRAKNRLEYATTIPNCNLETLPGFNVLPWEHAKETSDAIFDWIKTSKKLL